MVIYKYFFPFPLARVDGEGSVQVRRAQILQRKGGRLALLHAHAELWARGAEGYDHGEVPGEGGEV